MSQMREALARAAIFDGVEPSAVAALTKQLRPVHFARGDTIFSEGEPGEWLYIIISGKYKTYTKFDGYLLVVKGSERGYPDKK